MTVYEFSQKGISLKLKSRQISLLLSSIWVQATSHLNTPANYEAIAHTYSLVVIFSQNKVIVYVVNASSLSNNGWKVIDYFLSKVPITQ